jgi:hypothetical protein
MTGRSSSCRLQVPGMSIVSHHQTVIEFDAARRETVLVVKKTARDSTDTERPNRPIFRFENNSCETVRIIDQRASRIGTAKEVFLQALKARRDWQLQGVITGKTHLGGLVQGSAGELDMAHGFVDYESCSVISAAKKLPSHDCPQPKIRIPTSDEDTFTRNSFRINPFGGYPMHRIFAANP